jgi:hypothetical protein
MTRFRSGASKILQSTTAAPSRSASRAPGHPTQTPCVSAKAILPCGLSGTISQPESSFAGHVLLGHGQKFEITSSMRLTGLKFEM